MTADDDDQTVELDEHAALMLDQYSRATEAINEWDALRIKARDQLMDWLAVNGAHVGTVDGKPVVTLVDSERETFDSKRFREDEPTLYRQYLRLTRVRALRLRGSR